MYLGKYFFIYEIQTIQRTTKNINKIYSEKYPYGRKILKISKKLTSIPITLTKKTFPCGNLATVIYNNGGKADE